MAENQNFKCSGNCLNCLPAQRTYCASQPAYSNMKVLDTVMGAILELKSDVSEMKAKIEALQNNEAMLFDPNEEKLSVNIAQSGDGAEIDAPIQLNN